MRMLYEDGSFGRAKFSMIGSSTSKFNMVSIASSDQTRCKIRCAMPTDSLAYQMVKSRQRSEASLRLALTCQRFNPWRTRSILTSCNDGIVFHEQGKKLLLLMVPQALSDVGPSRGRRHHSSWLVASGVFRPAWHKTGFGSVGSRKGDWSRETKPDSTLRTKSRLCCGSACGS